jgi:peptidoglycan-associated lipoprotein
MTVKILGAFAAVALLAACSTPAPTASTSGAGASAAAPAGIVPGTQEDLVTNVGDRVLFSLNSSTLGADKVVLDRQAAWLSKYSTVAVQIAGNCDERGTEEYNIALGQRRANTARDYLVAKGVASSRISTISYGKDRPVDPASNEAAWAKNRNAITSVK